VCACISLSARSQTEHVLVRAKERRIEYRMAKLRWMPYLHRSFFAKEPIIRGSSVEIDPQLLRDPMRLSHPLDGLHFLSF